MRICFFFLFAPPFHVNVHSNRSFHSRGLNKKPRNFSSFDRDLSIDSHTPSQPLLKPSIDCLKRSLDATHPRPSPPARRGAWRQSFPAAKVTAWCFQRCTMLLAPRFAGLAYASTVVHFPTRRLDACLKRSLSGTGSVACCSPLRRAAFDVRARPSPVGVFNVFGVVRDGDARAVLQDTPVPL